jgi:heat shock protein HslJ
MKYLIIVLMMGLVACNGSESTTDATPSADSATATDTMQVTSDTATLAGPWYLVPVLPSDTGARSTPQLIFNTDEKRFAGNTGCNSMNGSFELTDSSLVFDERIMMTKMACMGYNEDVFVKNLLRTNRYRFEQGMLVLMVGEEVLSRWTRTPTKPSVSNKT